MKQLINLWPPQSITYYKLNEIFKKFNIENYYSQYNLTSRPVLFLFPQISYSYLLSVQCLFLLREVQNIILFCKVSVTVNLTFSHFLDQFYYIFAIEIMYFSLQVSNRISIISFFYTWIFAFKTKIRVFFFFVNCFFNFLIYQLRFTSQ